MATNTGATHLDDLVVDYNAPMGVPSSTPISDAIESGKSSASDLADTVMQKAGDAGEYLKTNSKKLAQSAKENASVAAETVKANPGKTAAIIGGLVAATAAVVAGAKMYQANADKKPAKPRAPASGKTAAKSKSSSQ
jgi:hypothetical protein